MQFTGFRATVHVLEFTPGSSLSILTNPDTNEFDMLADFAHKMVSTNYLHVVKSGFKLTIYSKMDLTSKTILKIHGFGVLLT